MGLGSFIYRYICMCIKTTVLQNNRYFAFCRLFYFCILIVPQHLFMDKYGMVKVFLNYWRFVKVRKRSGSCSEMLVGKKVVGKVELSILCYNSGSSWWWGPLSLLPPSIFPTPCLNHWLYIEQSQPLSPVLWGRPIVTEGTPLLFVRPLHPGASLKCWLSYLPTTPLQSFLQAAPALNRQSLQTPGNLYTPVSGHGRCISNCQCALPDALLSFDPIHSSGCVPVAVIYTHCDFTDV